MWSQGSFFFFFVVSYVFLKIFKLVSWDKFGANLGEFSTYCTQLSTWGPLCSMGCRFWVQHLALTKPFIQIFIFPKKLLLRAFQKSFWEIKIEKKGFVKNGWCILIQRIKIWWQFFFHKPMRRNVANSLKIRWRNWGRLILDFPSVFLLFLIPTWVS